MPRGACPVFQLLPLRQFYARADFARFRMTATNGNTMPIPAIIIVDASGTGVNEGNKLDANTVPTKQHP